jgi:Flp pilus assembly protein TadG
MRSLLKREDGQTAVEFAIVLPLLVALVLGIAQFGIAFNNYVTLTDATRAGARKAIVARLAGGSTADAETAVRDAAGSLTQSKLNVTVNATDWTQAGSVVTVTASYPYEISIPLLGMTIAKGDLKSTQKERLE